MFIRRLVVAAALLAALPAHAQDAATQQLLQEADKYYDQGDFDRAASNFDRAIRSQPKDVPSSAYAKRASLFLFAKRYADGLAWITQIAERTWPDDDLILEQKAVILSRLEGRKADAVAIAERVVKRRASSYTLHSLLGDHYYLQGAGSAEQTAHEYELYLRNRPPDLAAQDGLVRVKLGFAYLHLNRFPDAEKQLDEAVRGGGGDANIAANARKGLCAAYAGGGNWDRAVTMCERVIADKRAVRGDPSPQYNLGVAYLKRDRLDEALRSADAYVAARPREPKGYVLRAQVYQRRNRLAEAEAQLNQAESFSPSDAEVARELGRVYLKQKRGGKAVEKLQRAAAARPDDVDTIAVLAEAYLADGHGESAATQAEKALALPGQDKNVELLGLAGEGHYAAGALPRARASFEKALAALKEKGLPADARLRSELVDTINRQAAERWATDDITSTERLLGEAQAVDPESTRTSYNLGLVAEQKGDHERAIKLLSARLQRTPGDLLTNRVIAKAYLGSGNEAKAAEHYARAATEAGARRNLSVLAVIYTEWAPLLMKAPKPNYDDAVDKLEQAVQYSRGQAFERAAKRNLAVAYFRRGYERLRARRGADAVEDLENATRDPSLLSGSEPDVFNFALGLAYLDANQGNRATGIFQSMSKKGNLGFLKPPFDSIGADFFAAYTLYRDNSAAAHAKATGLLERLAGKTGGALGSKVKDLLRSNWELIAFDAYNRGQAREAEAALRKASSIGQAERRVAAEHNQAVLEAERNPDAAKAALQRFTDRVPEALVNLGILAERDGDAKGAYDLWTQARSRGARGGRLDEWIDSKKRLFGF